MKIQINGTKEVSKEITDKLTAEKERIILEEIKKLGVSFDTFADNCNVHNFNNYISGESYDTYVYKGKEIFTIKTCYNDYEVTMGKI